MSHCPKGNNYSDCPWRQDPKDDNHYRCLDCGRDRYINRPGCFSIVFGCLFWIVIIIIAISIFGCENNPKIDDQNLDLTSPSVIKK